MNAPVNISQTFLCCNVGQVFSVLTVAFWWDTCKSTFCTKMELLLKCSRRNQFWHFYDPQTQTAIHTADTGVVIHTVLAPVGLVFCHNCKGILLLASSPSKKIPSQDLDRDWESILCSTTSDLKNPVVNSQHPILFPNPDGLSVRRYVPTPGACLEEGFCQFPLKFLLR